VRYAVILVIDNQDSFVYNLARYAAELNKNIEVVRNDKISINTINNMQPSHIILSPGPCIPDNAGITLPLIKYFSGRIPILGVCLGHQAIGQSFGGIVKKAKKPMHGMSSSIIHDGTGLFNGIKKDIVAGRYHSLILDPELLPDCFHVNAVSTEDEIMSIQHKKHLTFGVQFHPESIMTEYGHQLIANFILSSSNQMLEDTFLRTDEETIHSKV
jgi:para-aminobenzoate synthetase component 2